MRRREAIAGIGSLGVLAAAGYARFGDRLGSTAGTQPEHDAVELRTIAAAGSVAGTIDVPVPDRVTFVEIFATTCTICQAEMPDLRAVHDDVGDEIAFVGVTAEQPTTVSDEAVAAWWAAHDGNWPVARDPELAFVRYYSMATPTAVLFDRDGLVRWTHTGRKAADDVYERIEDVR